ncbi:hypothetical protein EVAR_4634_1 [Eumeta japonica]|uniref:Uncharacterized protein n=1 Tax=Eumeta variegata TaxID=151549 RepID=A0A4C1SZ29_EUMVA|nr:hypothetical protein EVAR_4634_1 [Eumeta japonica]
MPLDYHSWERLDTWGKTSEQSSDVSATISVASERSLYERIIFWMTVSTLRLTVVWEIRDALCGVYQLPVLSDTVSSYQVNKKNYHDINKKHGDLAILGKEWHLYDIKGLEKFYKKFSAIQSMKRFIFRKIRSSQGRPVDFKVKDLENYRFETAKQYGDDWRELQELAWYRRVLCDESNNDDDEDIVIDDDHEHETNEHCMCLEPDIDNIRDVLARTEHGGLRRVRDGEHSETQFKLHLNKPIMHGSRSKQLSRRPSVKVSQAVNHIVESLKAFEQCEEVTSHHQHGQTAKPSSQSPRMHLT